MEWWVNGVIHIDDKIKMVNILLKTNIPSFSPSRRIYEPEATIPIFDFRGKFGNPKIPIFSAACRNPDTFN